MIRWSRKLIPVLIDVLPEPSKLTLTETSVSFDVLFIEGFVVEAGGAVVQ